MGIERQPFIFKGVLSFFSDADNAKIYTNRTSECPPLPPP